MANTSELHKWQFKPRFRRQIFGWKSQPAIVRIKEAVSEIKKVARKDPALAAEGAVCFLERVSAAIENVDGSSGSISTAVNRAIEALVPIIANAPADQKTRTNWLNRLWEAHASEQIPYIYTLGDHWGELCGTKEIASAWADELLDTVKACHESGNGGYFHGTSACLSALYRAGRFDELNELMKVREIGESHREEFVLKSILGDRNSFA
jgi:hypothetical protein